MKGGETIIVKGLTKILADKELVSWSLMQLGSISPLDKIQELWDVIPLFMYKPWFERMQ